MNEIDKNQFGIGHIAIWVDDLEKMRLFYQTYFGVKASTIYMNKNKGFTSYFLTFKEKETRMELMHKESGIGSLQERGWVKGLAHFAISVGSKEMVDQITEQLRTDHYQVTGEPRITGDGYYESVVLDPEGNHIEITI